MPQPWDLVGDMFYFEDYTGSGSHWGGIKRADFEDKRHAVPEGNQRDLEACLAATMQLEYFEVERLAVCHEDGPEGVMVTVWSPRNAYEEEDYLHIPHADFVRMLTESSSRGILSTGQLGRDPHRSFDGEFPL